MNKAEFVAEVARKASITRAEAARAVDAVFETKGYSRAHETDLRPAAAESGVRSNGRILDEEIRSLAVGVWENVADAEEFLITPHGLLDGQTPLAASRTLEGAKRVREILLALEYGLPV
ncbi:MAG TPA: antitoxin Xre/MbcA/ParS toxin-binding domain-containing protein [Longimicrobium sp.]|nr:antitoxin Xre/MbcA/ParS toxin-binding domain-containing protein [Longimicrobium sp.]